jgi:hypothetical protein
MLAELDNYDWQEVFKYAEPDSLNKCAGDEAVSNAGFSREDVVAILHYEDGINDEKNWEMLGFVRDGRWFYISAGCDYSGWG